MTLRAGAGRAEVTLSPAGLPLNGFGTVHDPLQVRALVLADDQTRAVLVLADFTSLPTELISETKLIASQPPYARAGAAGLGRCLVGVNRDLETTAGWWLGANDDGVRDPEVPLLVLEGLDGARIAMVATVAVQSSVTSQSVGSDGHRAVSGDLAGAAARYLEERDAGCVALVLTGAAGDQAPICTVVRRVQTPDGGWSTRDAHEAGFLLVELLGERLGAALWSAATTARQVLGVPLTVRRHGVALDAQVIPGDIGAIRPTRHYQFVPDGTVDAHWVTLQLGEAGWSAFSRTVGRHRHCAARRLAPSTHADRDAGGRRRQVHAGGIGLRPDHLRSDELPVARGRPNGSRARSWTVGGS
ncbi:MAG: hypothetical protein QM804_05925 [Propionicimonas sp.]